ncbi:hypothetical protein RRG08_009953 [Elysia crispata]|uniref:Uncharacterized protein n=1 Tax=Elysia crispata TaxID=231223 RepID=A0AAE1ARV4_9GAST|nr:hypothetical protein RRG08_009953 [Elysia crispata]
MKINPIFMCLVVITTVVCEEYPKCLSDRDDGFPEKCAVRASYGSLSRRYFCCENITHGAMRRLVINDDPESPFDRVHTECDCKPMEEICKTSRLQCMVLKHERGGLMDILEPLENSDGSSLSDRYPIIDRTANFGLPDRSDFPSASEIGRTDFGGSSHRGLGSWSSLSEHRQRYGSLSGPYGQGYGSDSGPYGQGYGSDSGPYGYGHGSDSGPHGQGYREY